MAFKFGAEPKDLGKKGGLEPAATAAKLSAEKGELARVMAEVRAKQAQRFGDVHGELETVGEAAAAIGNAPKEIIKPGEKSAEDLDASRREARNTFADIEKALDPSRREARDTFEKIERDFSGSP